LTLGFDAEMSASFLEGNLDLPTADEPDEDIARTSIEIGSEEGLWFELAVGIADEKPPDRHRRHARVIPKRGAAGDLDDAVGSTVPETDVTALPADFAIPENGGKLFQWLALDRRPPTALALLRREVEQVGIEAQASDHADMVAHCGEEVDRRERAVGDQYDIAIWKPATDLQCGLAGPIDERLGRSRFVGIEALGRGE